MAVATQYNSIKLSQNYNDCLQDNYLNLQQLIVVKKHNIVLNFVLKLQ